MSINQNKEFLEKLNELRDYLKKAFIVYYGEEYRDFITERIDSLRFLFVDKDFKLCDDINDYNILNNDEKEVLRRKDLEDAYGQVIPDIFPPLIVFQVTPKISLHSIIHEMNHSLHEFDAARNNPEASVIKTKTSLGFSGRSDDSVYELINEYMTRDILKIAENIIPKDEEKLDFAFDPLRYVYLDMVANNYVEKMYNKEKEALKYALINFCGESYYNDSFGNDKWDYLIEKFAEIEADFHQCLWDSDSLNIEESVLYNHIINILYDDYCADFGDLDNFQEEDFSVDELLDELFPENQNENPSRRKKK